MDVVKDLERQDFSAEIADLTRRLGRAPNASELAKDLGIDRDEVIETIVRGQASVGRYALAPAGDGHMDPVAPCEDADQLESQLAQSINVDGLSVMLGVLSEYERQVVLLRLTNSLTHREIAERLACSPVAVSRILRRSLALLRERS